MSRRRSFHRRARGRPATNTLQVILQTCQRSLALGATLTSPWYAHIRTLRLPPKHKDPLSFLGGTSLNCCLPNAPICTQQIGCFCGGAKLRWALFGLHHAKYFLSRKILRLFFPSLSAEHLPHASGMRTHGKTPLPAPRHVCYFSLLASDCLVSHQQITCWTSSSFFSAHVFTPSKHSPNSSRTNGLN